MARIESPCIGICSTTLGDTICRGCKRHSDEILSWGRAEPEARDRVMQRIETLTSETVRLYFNLVDPDQLEQQLIQRRIRYTKRFNPECWIVDLLRIGAGRIRNVEAYGIRLTDHALSLASASEKASAPLLEQLYQMINRTLLDETNRLLCEKS